MQRRRSSEANQTLQDVWPFPIHFLGLLTSGGILPGAKFTLRPSIALSYIGSVTERHSSSGRQPNFAAWYKKWNCGTFAQNAANIRPGGHHFGHRHTF